MQETEIDNCSSFKKCVVRIERLFSTQVTKPLEPPLEPPDAPEMTVKTSPPSQNKKAAENSEDIFFNCKSEKFVNVTNRARKSVRLLNRSTAGDPLPLLNPIITENLPQSPQKCTETPPELSPAENETQSDPEIGNKSKNNTENIPSQTKSADDSDLGFGLQGIPSNRKKGQIKKLSNRKLIFQKKNSRADFFGKK